MSEIVNLQDYSMELSGYGNTDVFVKKKLGLLTPDQDEVLIKVHASGINRLDILQRKGLYPPPEGAPLTPGLEIAGEIISIGSMVSNFKKGDHVCALLSGGGYATQALAKAGHCFAIGSLDYKQAAGMPEAIITVWANVFKLGKLKKNDVFLIHGGTSGIGIFAIQMAKKIGAKVIATVGSKAKQEFCEKLGADYVINYKEEDFEEAILSHLSSVDVILDMVGGDYSNKNIRLLSFQGRLIQIAFLRGNKAEVSIAEIMRKQLVWTGSTLRSRSDKEKSELVREVKENFWPFVLNGSIKSIIDSEFDLENVSQAHLRMEEGSHIGKIILTNG